MPMGKGTYGTKVGRPAKKKPVKVAANIAKKRARIKAQKAAGKKPERMRKPGTKGAPTAASFRAAAKTARKPRRA